MLRVTVLLFAVFAVVLLVLGCCRFTKGAAFVPLDTSPVQDSNAEVFRLSVATLRGKCAWVQDYAVVASVLPSVGTRKVTVQLVFVRHKAGGAPVPVELTLRGYHRIKGTTVKPFVLDATCCQRAQEVGAFSVLLDLGVMPVDYIDLSGATVDAPDAP